MKKQFPNSYLEKPSFFTFFGKKYLMRKIPVLICIAFFFSLPYEGKTITLSPKAEISVLTCGPSRLVHAIYGHTAIRVNDPLRKFDVVFNYGVFSFSKPNFVYRFAKGQTDYMLAPEYFADFYKDYKRSGRSISEQVLHLTPLEKQRLLDFLIENAKPENREYRYNFFFDNCATRVRDVVENQVEGVVIFPGNSGRNKTFRKHVTAYQQVLPWMDFGIHLTLGSPSDQVATVYDEMFLPDFLMSHFAVAEIKTGNESRQLVKETRTIYNSGNSKKSGLMFLSPGFVLSVLLAFILIKSIWQVRKQRTGYLFDYLLLFLTGIIGLVLLWFVFKSEHPAMKPNYNLLWALPTNLVFMFAWMVKKWRAVLKWYWPALAVWLILFFGLNFLIPQAFHIGFILISLMLLSRSIVQSYRIYKLNF